MNRAHWVHVGCSWFHDMAPARAMGLKHLLLDRDGIVRGLAEPVTSVRSAEEVCDAVKRLFEAKDVRGMHSSARRPSSSPQAERLAYAATRPGEADLPEIWPDPLPIVVDTIQNHTDARQLGEALPDVVLWTGRR